eukprot:jgi/Mesvir1/17694/Mv07874-RA.1
MNEAGAQSPGGGKPPVAAAAAAPVVASNAGGVSSGKPPGAVAGLTAPSAAGANLNKPPTTATAAPMVSATSVGGATGRINISSNTSAAINSISTSSAASEPGGTASVTSASAGPASMRRGMNLAPSDPAEAKGRAATIMTASSAAAVTATSLGSGAIGAAARNQASNFNSTSNSSYPTANDASSHTARAPSPHESRRRSSGASLSQLAAGDPGGGRVSFSSGAVGDAGPSNDGPHNGGPGAQTAALLPHQMSVSMSQRLSHDDQLQSSEASVRDGLGEGGGADASNPRTPPGQLLQPGASPTAKVLGSSPPVPPRSPSQSLDLDARGVEAILLGVPSRRSESRRTSMDEAYLGGSPTSPPLRVSKGRAQQIFILESAAAEVSAEVAQGIRPGLGSAPRGGSLGGEDHKTILDMLRSNRKAKKFML